MSHTNTTSHRVSQTAPRQGQNKHDQPSIFEKMHLAGQSLPAPYIMNQEGFGGILGAVAKLSNSSVTKQHCGSTDVESAPTYCLRNVFLYGRGIGHEGRKRAFAFSHTPNGICKCKTTFFILT